MQRIFLKTDTWTLVDDVDFDLCGMYSWCDNGSGYAYAYVKGSNKTGTKHIYLHKIIAERMNLDTGKEVDHIDQNPYNCQRNNLREATHAENGANRSAQVNNQLGTKGVCFDVSRNKYKSQIKVNQKLINLGRFESLEEAKAAYKVAAIHYFGEFAHDGT